MNRAAARSPLVADGGPPHCPACGGRRLMFRTDRHGRATEQCECGHKAYVLRRDGKPIDQDAISHQPSAVSKTTEV